jgi:hypothetical protein
LLSLQNCNDNITLHTFLTSLKCHVVILTAEGDQSKASNLILQLDQAPICERFIPLLSFLMICMMSRTLYAALFLGFLKLCQAWWEDRRQTYKGVKNIEMGNLIVWVDSLL